MQVSQTVTDRIPGQRTLFAAIGLVAAVLAACTPTAPLATPTPDAGRDRAEVELRIVRNVELKSGHTLAVTFSDGRQTRALAPADFTEVQEGHAIAGPFETATAGNLRLTGALVDRGGNELATGILDLPLSPDRRYGVWVVVGSGDPAAGCLGCAGSRSFPLDPSLGYPSGVALSFVWGANSISDPVVY